jgi:hypothetical protein
MKVDIVLQDIVQPVSESAGSYISYTCCVIEGSSYIEFQSSALVPFSASVQQMRTAIVNAAIQAAAGQGKTVQSADCRVIGGLM